MEKEKYMKEIEKNLNCGKDKKAELCRELRSDIESAIESGEKWEAVEKRLGSPRELALELNGNLLPEDRRKSGRSSKKIIIIIAVAAVCIIGVAAYLFSRLPRSAAFGNSGMFEEEAVKAQVEAVIKLTETDNWDVILDTYGAEVMQTEAVRDSLTAAKQDLGTLGAYQKITNQFLYELKVSGVTYAAVEAVALYEERSVTYTMLFDRDLKLEGFYMK